MVDQLNDVGSSGNYLYYPVVSMDGVGDVYVVFDELSASTYELVMVATIDTPISSSTQLSSAATLHTSSTYYDPAGACPALGCRWGDYSGAAVDPSNPNDVWVVSEDTDGNVTSWCSTAQSCWNSYIGLYTTFAPQAVGRPVVTTFGTQTLVFWRGSNNDLWEAWYSGAWNGPVDLTATRLPSNAGPLASAPSVLISGSQVVIFWQGTNNDLWEAWYSGRWSGAVDLTATQLPSKAGPLASAPSVLLYGSQLVIFWQGTNNDLWEAWYSGRWNGAVDLTATQLPSNAGQLASAPSVLVYGSQVVIFWQGSNNDLWEAWFSGRWFGAVDLTATQLPSNAGPLASAPSVLLYGSQVVVFWQGSNNDLWEAWFSGRWFGAVDLTATQLPSNAGPLASAPSVLVYGNQVVIFWQGTNNDLWEAWYGNGWNGALDWTKALGSTGTMTSPPTLLLVKRGPLDVFWQGTGQTLWEAWYQGGWNGPFNWSDGGPR